MNKRGFFAQASLFLSPQSLYVVVVVVVVFVVFFLPPISSPATHAKQVVFPSQPLHFAFTLIYTK